VLGLHTHAQLHHSISDGENGGGRPGNGEVSAVWRDGIGRNVAVRYVSITVLCPQLTEQCLGFLEVGCIKALGEPTVDRREELVSLSALALLLPQASKAHGRAQAVLRLGSDPRGNIVDRDEDALPLPVEVRTAEEAICDQRPAGRTLGGTLGRDRGSQRPCSGRRRLHPPALRADAARQPPAAPVG